MPVISAVHGFRRGSQGGDEGYIRWHIRSRSCKICKTGSRKSSIILPHTSANKTPRKVSKLSFLGCVFLWEMFHAIFLIITEVNFERVLIKIYKNWKKDMIFRKHFKHTLI